MRARVGELIVLLVVVSTFSFSIAYSNFLSILSVKEERYHMLKFNKKQDVKPYEDEYIYRMYFNKELEKSQEIFVQYRILVPYLARLVPFVPYKIFGPNHKWDKIDILFWNFTVINFFFLIGIGIVIYYLVRGFGMSSMEGLLGSMLFYGIATVVRSGAYPSTDTGSYFFLFLAALAVQRQNLWLLMSATTIGIFVKEQVAVVLLLIVLSPVRWDRRLRLIIGIVPAFAIYLIIRLCIWPVENDYMFRGQFVSGIPIALKDLITPRGMARIFGNFSFLWLFCFYSIFRSKLPLLLSRWLWFVPLLLILTIMVGGRHFHRHLLPACIVIIPLAVIGLNDLLTKYRNINTNHKLKAGNHIEK